MKRATINHRRGVSDYAIAVLADSPLIYWRLNEAPGATTAVDSSGNGRNGTYNTGTELSLGNGGPLLHGGGTSARIILGADTHSYVASRAASTNLDTALVTVEAFLRPDANDVSRAVFAGVTDGSTWRWYSHVFDSSFSRLAVNTDSDFDFGSGSNVQANLPWKHCAITWDGTTWKCYINGLHVGTDHTGNGPVTAVTNKPFVVGWDDSSTQRWHGDIAEVAVYSTALSAGRIAAHYAAA